MSDGLVRRGGYRARLLPAAPDDYDYGACLVAYQGVINAENFKPISFQKRMIMIKSKISNDLQRTIEYNYTSIIHNVYRQYYETWGEWSEQEQKMAVEIGKRALERVKVLGKNRGTFHESTLIMTAMDVLLSGHDQAPCNTRELGRILE